MKNSKAVSETVSLVKINLLFKMFYEARKLTFFYMKITVGRESRALDLAVKKLKEVFQ